MFGLAAFSTLTFASATPGAFATSPVVVIATVGAITTTIAGTAITANALIGVTTVGQINSAAGAFSSISGTAVAAMTGVNATFSLISLLTPFTWTTISDSVDESWGAVTTTSTSEGWIEVEEDTTDEATTWTDA